MTLVQGVGDEVIGVFVALVVTGVTYLLWLSTRVRETPQVRSVILATRVTASEVVRTSESASEQGENVDSHFQEVLDEIRDGLDDLAPSNESVDDVVPDELPANETESVDEQNADSASLENPIRMRLRFLDETTFEAETSLNETLIRFRRRFLDSRLNIGVRDKVRLIFNGRVLYRDDQIMQELGVYDECVVHCVVSRDSEPQQNVQEARSDIDQDFDLTTACFPLLGTLLFGGWGCLLIYSHYFSVTSITILTGLTLAFAASYANSVMA